MALTAREQAMLDLIEIDLLRRDPDLATALAAFALPPGTPDLGEDPAEIPLRILRSRIRGAGVLFAVLGALLIVAMTVVVTQLGSKGCADPQTHPSCARNPQSAAADLGLSPGP